MKDKKNYEQWEEQVVEKDSLRCRLEIDALTGLLNKEATMEDVTKILQEFPEKNHALLIIDVDNFSDINEREGIVIGDRILTILADLFTDSFRQSDIIGRVGGDEFVVLLVDVPSEDSVRRKISQLTGAIKRSVNYSLPTRISLSIGFTMSNGKVTTYENMFRQADEALYQAKRVKKGKIFEYGNLNSELTKDYCSSDKTVLVVEDNVTIRNYLMQNLVQDYYVLEAANGQEALELLENNSTEIDGIILDLVMPVMDGYKFLEIVHKKTEYRNIPIIIATGNEDQDNETKVLKLGAWDFVTKPFNIDVLKFRLRNAILHSQLTAFNQLKYLAEFDQVTGIYNKKKFFEMTHEMLVLNPEKQFVFVRLDIENFKLINSFFGASEGDRYLRKIGEVLRKYAKGSELCTYGHMLSDIFCFCVPFLSRKGMEKILEDITERIRGLCDNFRILPKFGLYVISDPFMSVDEMYDHAIIASKECKGNYICNYAYYEESMWDDLEKENELSSEMVKALEEGQFVVYFQPKYETKTGKPSGAEALVRWIHPEKGMISPGDFIPLFEKNGFITKLDYFVWEEVCKFINRKRREGKYMPPISVNVSRMNLYNPMLVDQLKELVERYNVPASMLNLEITETAYTENPLVMHETLKRLQEIGFVIMMDDFGSGYSSLNMLKDLTVDILKIDMFFLSDNMSERAERIIASIVRMAKWLNMQVVVEGVEQTNQVKFLQSIGCDYIQGYYYARPMPVEEYEEIIEKCLTSPLEQTLPLKDNEDKNELWQAIPYASMVFDGLLQPVAVYRYDGEEEYELLRANAAFAKAFGYDEMTQHEVNEYVDARQLHILRNGFKNALKLQEEVQIEYRRKDPQQKLMWAQVKIKYSGVLNGHNIFVGIFQDITQSKKSEKELERFQKMIHTQVPENPYMLIADDQESSREILKELFEDKYRILEAEEGQEALDLLEMYGEQISVVLLDLRMPKMTGGDFLKAKNQDERLAEIPVVVVSSDTSEVSQLQMLELGVNDYITKPFVPEIAVQRVRNVLEFKLRFQELVQEYRHVKEESEKK